MSDEKPREWNIKGYLFDDNGRPGFNGVVVSRCDGPVPKINEIVRVIEYSAYEELKNEIKILRDLCGYLRRYTNHYKDCKLYSKECECNCGLSELYEQYKNNVVKKVMIEEMTLR